MSSYQDFTSVTSETTQKSLTWQIAEALDKWKFNELLTREDIEALFPDQPRTRISASISLLSERPGLIATTGFYRESKTSKAPMAVYARGHEKGSNYRGKHVPVRRVVMMPVPVQETLDFSAAPPTLWQRIKTWFRRMMG